MTWQQQLTEQRLQWYAKEYPQIAKNGLIPPAPKYKDSTTKDLQNAAIDWFKFHGCYVSRTNNTGTPRMIGGKLILTKTKKGKSDIDVTHEGRTIKVEIKCDATGDKMSLDQFKEYQKVTGAGGLYIVVGNMEWLSDWWLKYTQALILKTYPNDARNEPLQPVYERPGGDNLPTLQEWKQPASKSRPVPSTGDILEARMGKPPAFVKLSPANHRTDAELKQAITSLTQQGFKVAFRCCLYYVTKPEDKVYKRLPKGYTLQDTPMQDGTWEKRVVDKNGAHALEFEILYDVSRRTGYEGITGFKRRAEMVEKFCIPEFIIGKPHMDANGNPLPNDSPLTLAEYNTQNHTLPYTPIHTPGEVYVLDPKRDTTDGKMFHYLKVLKAVMAARGDNRKVKAGELVWSGETRNSGMWRVFEV